MKKILCPSPEKDCSGAVTHINGKKAIKLHTNSEQAFNCYKRHLLNQGYKQIGAREFYKEGEPVKFLTKKSRFGSPFRPGKGLEGKSSTFVPYAGKYPKQGTIVSE